MRDDDRIRLRHVVDAVNAAAAFTDGRTREDLDTDVMLAFALTHAVQIIGEAIARIIAMRNRLVHAYFDIDHDILWNTATVAAPALLKQILPLLARD